MDLIELMKKEMLRRKYSLRTIKTYVDCLKRFLIFCDKSPRTFNKLDIKSYLDLLVEKGVSGSTLNVNLNALGFVIRNILNKNFMIKIKYSKTPKTLPLVLTQKEVIKLIKSIENIKHKLMIKLLYSAGLRVSELVNLTVKDFEFENNYGWVRHGKGNKDRMFIIANSIKEELLNHIKENNLSYNNYLFEGRIGAISVRSIQEIVKKATKLAKINKKVHPHTLRHCLKENVEILTLEGWKKYNKLIIGELAPTLNLDTNQIEFKPIKDISVYDCYNEGVFEIKNKYLNYICTIEHKGIFKIAKYRQETINGKRKRWTEWNNWELKKFDELLREKNKRLIKHRISGISNGIFSIGKAKAGLLGWILTDGHISKRKNNEVIISQSLTANKEKCDYIETLLKEAKIAYSNKINTCKANLFNKFNYDMCTFRFLSGGNRGKIKGRNNDWILEWINKDRTPKYKLLKLKTEELQELYKCMMMGDGSKNQEFTDQNKKRIDFFRALCTLLGYRTFLGSKIQNNKNYFRTYVIKKDNCELYTKQIKIKKETGKFWCPEIENHTWIAKSNETIFITGNSYATHLIENGYDVASVQSLLGHNSAQTTMCYLHIAKMSMINVKSPLDKLKIENSSNTNPNYEFGKTEEIGEIEGR